MNWRIVYMKKNNFRSISNTTKEMKKILFAIVLIVSGLSQLKAQQKGVTYGKPSSFKIEEFDGSEMIVNFKMTIANTTSKGFGVTIKRGKVFRDGKHVGDYKLLRKIKIRKKQSDNFQFRLKVTFMEPVKLDMNNLNKLIGNGGSSEFKFTGTLKATWFIIWKRWPFEFTQNVSTASLAGLLGK